MVLTSIDELATGFEGCEKKLEIDFHLTNTKTTLRSISRATIDAILNEARCTIISVQHNRDFDAYVLSESSLFIYPSKILLKTCGTTLLLKACNPMLIAAKTVGAEPDFLQFSRSNFLFPSKQSFPHRAFNEETDYLNEQLGVTGEAYILGSLHGARWHLYIVDFNRVEAKEYKQQTLEIIMFNLDQTRMKTFYNANTGESKEEVKSSGKIGQPSTNGPEATRISGIDKLLPNALIDSHLFNPCGYSCNGMVEIPQENNSGSSSSSTSSADTLSIIGKQGKDQQAYFTIHITPEPECSFVSFETNAVLPNYTQLVKNVVNTFKPGSFCMSLFVDGSADIPDSRGGLDWEYKGYITKSNTHQAFEAGYNATCAQFESVNYRAVDNESYGDKILTEEEICPSPMVKPIAMPSMSTNLVLHGMASMGVQSSYSTVASLSLDQMKAIAFEKAKGRFNIEMTEYNFEESKANSNNNNNTNENMEVDQSLVNAANHILSTRKPDSAFCMLDIGQLVRRFYQWVQIFGRIEPVYTIPAEHGVPDGIALVLSALGCSFACSQSTNLQSLLSIGVPPSRLLFDRAVMSAAQIKFAAQQHVDLITAANVVELENIHKYHSKPKILLHIAINQTETDSNDSLSNTRVGAAMTEIPTLLQLANKLDLNLVGVKFDFNRACSASYNQLSAALQSAKQVFIQAEQAGFQLTILDMGIGLPSSASAFASELLQQLDQLFPAVDYKIMADPKAFFDQQTATMILNILQKSSSNSTNSTPNSATKRKASTNSGQTSNEQVIYYVNEAIKSATENNNQTDSSVNSAKRAKTVCPPAVLPLANKKLSSTTVSASLLSADSADSVMSGVELPELDVGDWLYLPTSISSTSSHNAAPVASSLDAPRLFYIAS